MSRKFNIPTASFGEDKHRSLLLNSRVMGNSGHNTPIGKSSITSTLLQNNYLALIDRMKEVLVSEE